MIMFWMMKSTFLQIGTGLCAVASACLAASPLAELPGKPGAHIEKIRALADGAWLHLGAPAADPKWGRARGRSWACRMPFAPELRGAFLFGEGVHGYVKPDGHVMDDLWFYDLQQHRWICCYPGAEVATLDLKINADGFEANARGEPIPLSPMAHAYEGITYDTDLRRFMAMPCPNNDYLFKSLKQKREKWLQDQTVNKSAASPWFFGSDTGKWNRRATATQSARSGYGDSFHYLPGQKRAFFRHGEEVWFYDTAGNAWTQAKPTGPPLPFGIDATSCYDAKRDRIYIGGGSYPVAPAGTNAFRIYDLKTNAWLDPQPKGAPCKGSNSYATNIAAMEYDSASDVVIVFRYGGKAEERGIFIYDPAANAWSEAPQGFPEKWGQCTNAFYDPALNAHFFHVAGDSEDNGTVWVYRHDNRQ
jgi:hypothetical protein